MQAQSAIVEVSLFDLGAKPRSLYLAQPNGLGTKNNTNRRANGPAVWSLAARGLTNGRTFGPKEQFRQHTQPDWAGLGKLLGPWPEETKTGIGGLVAGVLRSS